MKYINHKATIFRKLECGPCWRHSLWAKMTTLSQYYHRQFSEEQFLYWKHSTFHCPNFNCILSVYRWLMITGYKSNNMLPKPNLICVLSRIYMRPEITKEYQLDEICIRLKSILFTILVGISYPPFYSETYYIIEFAFVITLSFNENIPKSLKWMLKTVAARRKLILLWIGIIENIFPRTKRHI